MSAAEMLPSENKASVFNTAGYQAYPLKGIQSQTPHYPNEPSRNWATRPPDRGFNMNYLETLIVPETDKVNQNMFNRYILKDYSSLFNSKETPDKWMKQVRDLTPTSALNLAYQKRGHRDRIKGSQIPNPTS